MESPAYRRVLLKLSGEVLLGKDSFGIDSWMVDTIAAEIRDRVVSGISLTPYHVQILGPGTLPRSSSGKMRRAGALNMFLTGELLPPEKMGVLKMFKEVGKSQLAWGRFWLNKRRGSPSGEDSPGE